ncbi:hypothetical protein MG293_000260 [Ovis ammon polii]|uniref:Uncharacterized protein n=1 Tax=Ovis ammon polii TaxID=230172 RepID=A0AAD4YEE2_OVIAM|nr:hypothetical protein MG293_000260 [Ovis ammon polii]
MGSRPRSPGAYSSDRWGNQAGEPGPAKRRRTEERARPESESETAPSVDNLTGSTAAGALTRLLVLPAGCALHLPLDDVDLVLEPEPTSVLQVALGDFILTLVPEALLGSRVEGPSGQVLERAAVLSPPREYTALEPEFCGAVPEVACEEETNGDDANSGSDFLSPEMDPAGGLIAGLRSPDARARVLEWGAIAFSAVEKLGSPLRTDRLTSEQLPQDGSLRSGPYINCEN